MSAKITWALLIGTAAAGAVGLTWQYKAQTKLTQDLEVLREQNHALAELRNGNRDLAASLPPPAELTLLRTHRAALPQLRAEIDTLQARLRDAEQKSAPPSPVRFESGSKVIAADWKNAGASTSQAALETVLWAAAGGDVDALAKNLLLPEGKAREGAKTLFDSLAPAMQEKYGTPEQLIAALTIKDVPAVAAQVLAWHKLDTKVPTVQVELQLATADGSPRDLNLKFTQVSDGWKVVVPESAVGRYTALLKGPPVADAGGK